MSNPRVVQLLKSGMSFVCANCEKLWRNLDRGQSMCEASGNGRPCGGPLLLLDFPLYEGPLAESNWTSFCFVCGKPSAGAARVRDCSRMLGLCENHIDILDKMAVKVNGKELRVEHREVDLVTR